MKALAFIILSLTALAFSGCKKEAEECVYCENIYSGERTGDYCDKESKIMAAEYDIALDYGAYAVVALR